MFKFGSPRDGLMPCNSPSQEDCQTDKVFGGAPKGGQRRQMRPLEDIVPREQRLHKSQAYESSLSLGDHSEQARKTRP
jgi:hypothetical protein